MNNRHKIIISEKFGHTIDFIYLLIWILIYSYHTI